MDIAGGLYRELCVSPPWNSLYGSGGRAAAAVAALSPGSTLHSYMDSGYRRDDLGTLEHLGINLQLAHRTMPIAFAYFHPLSRPLIEPSVISREPPLRVDGRAVLRFGFVEGDAIVTARHAIYDPQTWRDPRPFGGNGSGAEFLAIVLNELELRSASGLEELEEAADFLLQAQEAKVVVVKRGARGAAVFESSGRSTLIPAYRSSRVFKIGTGDVFSALFAHLWAEGGREAPVAADLASRYVADYCGTQHLPVASVPLATEAVGEGSAGTILLEGAIDTLGCRYAMEEARYGLRELGLRVTSPALGENGDDSDLPAAVLVLADGLHPAAMKRLLDVAASGVPVVVLREGVGGAVEEAFQAAVVKTTDDFTSALYFAAWEAMEHPQATGARTS